MGVIKKSFSSKLSAYDAQLGQQIWMNYKTNYRKDVRYEAHKREALVKETM